jgi:Leucine-rich repeat (LRR) protein
VTPPITDRRESAAFHVLIGSQKQYDPLFSIRDGKVLSIQLYNIPDLFPLLPSLKHLQFLELSGDFPYLPEIIRQLKTLRKLSAKYVDLKEIPRWIGELTALEILILSHNNIRELPPEIGFLKNLHILALAFNEISEIPASMGNLKQLQDLILAENPITEFPPFLKSLPNLQSYMTGGKWYSRSPSGIWS